MKGFINVVQFEVSPILSLVVVRLQYHNKSKSIRTSNEKLSKVWYLTLKSLHTLCDFLFKDNLYILGKTYPPFLVFLTSIRKKRRIYHR